MSDPSRRPGAPSAVPSNGASWSPPAVVGPVITFRGKSTAASSLPDDARTAREAAFERGRSEGLTAAAAEVAQRVAELESRRQLFEGLARQMVAPLERCDEAATAELARLAVLVGAQLARRELAVDPAQVVVIIRECLAALPTTAREVRIHLHPRDAALVRREQGGLGHAAVTLVEDTAVSRGGCRIEAETSRIDARLEARIAAALTAVLGEPQPEPEPDPVRAADPTDTGSRAVAARARPAAGAPAPSPVRRPAKRRGA